MVDCKFEESAEIMYVEFNGCEDWGGMNYDICVWVDENCFTEEEISKLIEASGYDLSDDFIWSVYFEYDNIDRNGMFLETYYIDKDDEIVENGGVVADYLKKFYLLDACCAINNVLKYE